MANNKSAEKRIKITQRNRLQNKYYKTSVKTLIKLFYQTTELSEISLSSKEENLKNLLKSIYSLLDKGTKKNIFHKNTAGRKKSQLAAHLNSFLN